MSTALYKANPASGPFVHGAVPVRDEALDSILEVFDPSNDLFELVQKHGGLGENVPPQTLAAASHVYSRFSQVQTENVSFFLEYMEGWHTKFAPQRRSESLHFVYTKITGGQYILDADAETVAPRIVQTKRERHTGEMQRYHLGAMFQQEFYKTPEGREEARRQQDMIASAAVVTCKFVVASAVVHAGMYWRTIEHRIGAPKKSINEAMANEIAMFGIVNKDDRAIHKISAFIDETLKRLMAAGQGGQRPLDNLVVGAGLLNQITISNKAETEPSRREPAIATKVLSLNARSASTIVPGRTIFEDPSWSLQNLPRESINILRRVTAIGQYYILDGGRIPTSADANYSAVDEMSVLVPDASVDAMVRYDVRRALRDSQRFDETGALSSKHQQFINELPSLLNRTGMRIPSDGAVDPYVYRVENHLSRDLGRHAQSSDYRVIEQWGDMDLAYWSGEQMMLHARLGANVVRKISQQGNSISVALRDFQNLVRELYQFPAVVSDAEKRALVSYIKALCASNSATSLEMLKANKYGSFTLPTIKKVGTLLFFADNTGIVWLPIFIGPDQSDFNFRQLDSNNVDQQNAILKFDNALPFNISKNFARPWGFASLHHLRTLADLVGKAGYEEYDERFFSKAREILEVLDPYIELLRRVYPNSELWSPLYVPSYAVSGTGMSSYDSVHSFACNALDRVRLPLWFKQPTLESARVANSSEHGLLSQSGVLALVEVLLDDTAVSEIVDRTFTPAELDSIKSAAVHYLTHNDIDALADNALRDAANAEQVFVAVVDKLRGAGVGITTPGNVARQMLALALLNSLRAIGNPTLVEYLATTSKRQFVALINEWNAHESLGQAMRDAWADDSTLSTVKSYLQTQLSGVLLSIGAADMGVANVNAISAVLGLMRALQHHQNITVTFNRAFDAQIKRIDASVVKTLRDTLQQTRVTQTSRRTKRAREEVSNNTRAGVNAILNTRLLFDPSTYELFQVDLLLLTRPDAAEITAAGITADNGTWDNAPKIVVLKNNSYDKIADTLNWIGLGRSIWPSDPENDRPLAISVAPGTDLATLTDMFVSNTNNGLRATVFGNTGVLPFGMRNDDDGMLRSSKMARYSSGVSQERSSAQSLAVVTSLDRRNPTYVGNSMRANITGPLYSVQVSDARNVVNSIAHRHFLAARTTIISDQAPDHETRIAGLLAVFSSVHRSTLDGWVDYGLPIPDSCFIIAQPSIMLETEAIVAFSAGAGILYYAHEDVSNQYKNDSKQWLLHFSMWVGCAIPDESNLMLIPDVRITGYRGGFDMKVFDDLREFDARAPNFKTKSAFVFSCGARFSRETALQAANPMSLFGKFEYDQFPHSFENNDVVFDPTPQYPSALFYSYIWNFANMPRLNEAGLTSFHALANARQISGIMYMGRHLAWSAASCKHDVEIQGTGHLGNMRPPFSTLFSTGIAVDSSRT